MVTEFDAVVIGSGPNGLAAGIMLAKREKKVLVLEAASQIGGGLRTAELTLPGFHHDVCSSVYPLISVSPFFRELVEDGVQPDLISPDIPLAHVVNRERAISIYQDLERTIGLMDSDGDAYGRLVRPFLEAPQQLFEGILSPPLKIRNPMPLLRFGWRGFRSANSLANKWFDSAATKGMFAGMAAHSMLPLDRWLTGAVGLMFCIAAHTNGWPIACGGAGSISGMLAAHLESLGGQIETSAKVSSLSELPSSRVVLFDTTPSQMLEISGSELPMTYQRRLKKFRHGPGICKVDWALDGPIPWLADECKRAGTVHLGGTLDSIKASEQAAWKNQTPDKPFLLVTQPSLFDPARAPQGKHVAWAYCHVPRGSTTDFSRIMEQQIEEAAPGFRDLIVGRHVLTASDLHKYNANYIGGDISGGAMNLWQVVARPVLRIDPYATPDPRLFICSASTPPGPGVHGMCGYNAAKSALSRVLNFT